MSASEQPIVHQPMVEMSKHAKKRWSQRAEGDWRECFSRAKLVGKSDDVTYLRHANAVFVVRNHVVVTVLEWPMLKRRITHINKVVQLMQASSNAELEALVDLPLGGTLAAYILGFRCRVERRSSHIEATEALNKHLIRKLREAVGFEETGKILEEGRALAWK